MRPTIAAVLVAVSACSPGDERASLAATGNIVASGAAAADEPGRNAEIAPRPGTLKTFGDWTVGCDNVLQCTMASLMPEDGEMAQATMNLTRAAGAQGGITVAIDSRNDAGAAALLAVDAKRVGGIGSDGNFGGDGARAIAAAIANGRTLSVLDMAGKTLATISLKGASAALRYIDAAQRRTGGTSALVAKGAAGAVPAAPSLPTITALRPQGTATIPNTVQVAAMRKRAGCQLDETSGTDITPEAHALGGGKTLVILPCSAGAYNLIAALFVIAGTGVAPAIVDAPSGFGEAEPDARKSVPSIVNGEFADGILGSYAKGRGIGDCGVEQAFVWDGARFRLSRQAEMGECRGNTNYITTWRTKVARR